MIIGCCTTIDYYDLLCDLGYDAISLAGKELAAMSEETFRIVREKLLQGSLRFLSVNAAFPPSVKLNGAGFDPEALWAYTRTLCGRMAAVGAKNLGVGSPKSRTVGPDTDFARAEEQFAIALKILCQVAQEYGIRVCLEACCDLETDFINTTDQALQWLSRVDAPNLCIVYDIYHAYMMGETPDVIGRALKHISGVHISKPLEGKRYYPDEACMTMFRPYIDALLAGGYDGEFATEAFDGSFVQGVTKAMEVLAPLRHS